MAVNTPQTEITPFTSTVPLVQIPPDAMEQQSRPAQPLQGEFGKKGTGALAIGDALLKGFMAGHQQKEQRKQAQAQATINAADAATEAAYAKYQDALTQANGQENDQTKAAYQAYQTTFEASKQAKAKFVIPEKPGKGDNTQKKGEKGEKKTGWSNFKDFFEANPHIVPQIALMTMQPKPPGAAPETKQTVQNLESQRLANETARVRQQNENTYQQGFTTYAHLSPEEVSALPPDAKKGYETWANARAALTPMKFSGTPQLYVDPKTGRKLRLYKEEQEQYYPDVEPYIASQEAKPGTPGFYLQAKAKELGKDVNSLSTEELESAMGQYRASQMPGSTTTSSTTTDPQGNRTTTTKRTPTPGGISKPPSASAAPSGQGKTAMSAPPQAGKGGISKPPGVSRATWQTMQVTRQATEKQQAGYRKAESAYSKAIADADKAFATAQSKAASSGDASILETAKQARDRAYGRAQLDREDAKASVAATYDAAVKSIGGTPGSQSNPNQFKVGDVTMYNGKQVKITAIDPNTGQATIESIE